MLILLMRPSFDPAASKNLIAKGLNASPGAAVGFAIFDADRAKAMAAEDKSLFWSARKLHRMMCLVCWLPRVF